MNKRDAYVVRKDGHCFVVEDEGCLPIGTADTEGDAQSFAAELNRLAEPTRWVRADRQSADTAPVERDEKVRTIAREIMAADVTTTDIMIAIREYAEDYAARVLAASNRWIPVAERLPATTAERPVIRLYAEGSGITGMTIGPDWPADDWLITHWLDIDMPARATGDDDEG